MKKLLTAVFAMASFAATAQQNTLLTQAFWQSSSSLEAVQAEVAKGNNPAQFNGMAMDPVVMAINGSAPYATIKYLLDQPGNTPDKLTHDGRTYLHWAANRGNTEVMEYLFSKGAKVNVLDSHGATPLTFAAGSGQPNVKVYDLLLAHGDNLKTNVNPDGANALLLSISNDKDFTLCGQKWEHRTNESNPGKRCACKPTSYSHGGSGWRWTPGSSRNCTTSCGKWFGFLPVPGKCGCKAWYKQ
jgi:hypothetical protein